LQKKCIRLPLKYCSHIDGFFGALGDTSPPIRLNQKLPRQEKTEKLRQSILSKAFSGELVEIEAEIARREGRDYETAEVLLERIKKEKEKEKNRKKTIDLMQF
jgi:hypothetical protein